MTREKQLSNYLSPDHGLGSAHTNEYVKYEAWKNTLFKHKTVSLKCKVKKKSDRWIWQNFESNSQMTEILIIY